jgi:hypothetical protein
MKTSEGENDNHLIKVRVKSVDIKCFNKIEKGG